MEFPAQIILEAEVLDNQQERSGVETIRIQSSPPSSYSQGGGNPLHNSNVAVTALHVRHYPFPAFQGNIAFVS